MSTRFQFITKEKDNDNFISMSVFWNSISKKNGLDEQKKLSPFTEQLDLFYICLLIGLKNNLKIDTHVFEKSDVNDAWTKNLKTSGAKDYILGLFLSKITNEFKDDQSKIKKTINEVLDNDSETNLSDFGMEKINSYCFAGYIKILEELKNNTPSTIVKFLNVVNKLLRN
jgi:hypothetical protein|tara:strand:+ start:2421 stop:2930 length:510 start_codon:yes stop_codon:yes gene_type:complete